MNLLLVDDLEQEKRAWEETLRTVEKNNKANYSIELLYSKDLDNAKEQIKNKTIDFLIVDLKLGRDEPEGNVLINMVYELSFRIPTIVLTGTPENVLDDSKILNKFKKGETSISSIINYLISVYNTGLTKILGKTGIIDKYLTEVFTKNLIPSIEKWIEYAKFSAVDTEKALLRYTLNHLYEMLDESVEKYFPEEIYIKSISKNKLATGSLITKDEIDYIVLSPACDLTVRKNGEFKTDSILLAKIEGSDKIITPLIKNIKNSKKKNDKLVKIYTNTETLYYHWLPKTSLFHGGVINFRKVYSIPKDSISEYKYYDTQISPYFIKDIISRFSSYYARQGQPDINNQEYLLQN